MQHTEQTAPGARVNPVTGRPFTTTSSALSALAGTVIGYGKRGPIRLQAGGSQPVAGGAVSTSDSTGGPVVTEIGGQEPPPATAPATTAAVIDTSTSGAGTATVVTTTEPPAGTPPEGGQQTTGIESLPEWAQKEIKQARKGEATKREAAKTADEARAAAEAKHEDLLTNIAKVLGLAPDDDDKSGAPEVDADQLTQQLATAQQEARENKVELAVYRAAAAHGGDPESLLDSRDFAGKVLKLDPSGEDFQKKIGTLISKAVADNPKYAAKQPEPTSPPAGEGNAPAGPSGGTFAGGPGSSNDPESMTVEDFRKRRKRE